MKQGIIIIVLGLLACTSYSQRSYDIGLIGGGSYYLGDINTSTQFKATNPAGGVFIRYNYNRRYSLRGNAIAGGLSGNDLSSRYISQNRRAASFYTPIIEIGGQFEFNFLPYEIGSDKHTHSFYVATGLDFLIASYASRPYQVAVPIGIGFKFNVTKRIGGGIEYMFRKTFTDYLDRLGGQKYFIQNSKDYLPLKQNAYLHDNDWYAVIGLFFSYKIPAQGIKCHTYD